MTNAELLIIQWQVCRRWEVAERREKESRGPLWEQISLVPHHPHPHPEEKASANRFKIRRPTFNLGRGAGATAVPTTSQDWAPGTSGVEVSEGLHGGKTWG